MRRKVPATLFETDSWLSRANINARHAMSWRHPSRSGFRGGVFCIILFSTISGSILHYFIPNQGDGFLFRTKDLDGDRGPRSILDLGKAWQEHNGGLE
jgi:hypothetical protein